MGTVQSSGTVLTDYRTDFPSDFPPQPTSGVPQASETAQTHVFPVQTQVVGQTRVVPVQTSVVQRSEIQSSGVGIWIAATVLRVISSVFCIGVLIAAIIALSAINEVDDILNERGGEYEDADSYRGAAGWLVFVGCAAIVFHVVMISIQIFYFKCTAKKYLTQYAMINAIFCILFALAFLAGGIANAIYAADNDQLWTDVCFFVFGFDGDEFCENLERVRNAEIASAPLSIISMIVFIILFVFMLCTGLTKVLASNNQSLSSQPQSAVAYPSSAQHVSPYPPTNTSQYVPPSAPPAAPPSAPPPSYDSVIAPAYGESTKTHTVW